ncbi:Putative cytochrome P450 [Septoria linicola]|uniref:Cytochrome P450 n=1 Tax=Septoria linicola TaxID=215465 RepID=A0A9Q9EEQ2_9PEZI|nr:Putative cytochrome P450 [Septoria linicola]
MRQWALEYGELFQIRVGWYNWVVVNSPQAMKEIFDKQSSSTSSKVPAPIGHDIITGGRRMFTMPYGTKWRLYRTVCHQLLSPKMTETFLPTQSLEIKQLLQDLARRPEHEIDPQDCVRRMSFSLMMTATYGRSIPSWDHEDVRGMLKGRQILGKISRPGYFMEDELPLLAKLPHWLQPSRKEANQLAIPVHAAKMRLWNILRESQCTDSAPECFGKKLLSKDFQEQGLTDEDAAWIASGLVEVGSETTSITLLNLMLHLASNLKHQDKAIAELNAVVGNDRSPCFEDLPQLPYVRACVKEVLRLHPIPTWGVKHYTDNDVIYKQWIIPKGTVVLGNTWAIQYDPIRYPEPEKFFPERYISHHKYAAEYAAMADPLQRDHYAFGAGRRICPGSRLAENTLNLALAHILWCFRIEPAIGDGSVDASSDAWEETAFRPPKPFKVRFVPREDGRILLPDYT